MQAFVMTLGRRQKRGLALFDVILAVGIIGILIAGGVLLLQTVQERIARNNTLQLVNQIRGESNRLYAGRPTYDGVTIQLLAQGGGLPDYVWRDSDGDEIYDAPGTDAYMSTYEKPVNVWGSATLKRITIGLADMDPGPCVDVLGPWAGKTRAVAGIVRAGVSVTAGAGITAKAATWWTNGAATGTPNFEFPAPFSATNVAAMCSGAAEANDIYIMFQG